MLRGVVHDPTSRRMGGVAGHAGIFSTPAGDVAVRVGAEPARSACRQAEQLSSAAAHAGRDYHARPACHRHCAARTRLGHRVAFFQQSRRVVPRPAPSATPGSREPPSGWTDPAILMSSLCRTPFIPMDPPASTPSWWGSRQAELAAWAKLHPDNVLRLPGSPATPIPSPVSAFGTTAMANGLHRHRHAGTGPLWATGWTRPVKHAGALREGCSPTRRASTPTESEPFDASG